MSDPNDPFDPGALLDPNNLLGANSARFPGDGLPNPLDPLAVQTGIFGQNIHDPLDPMNQNDPASPYYNVLPTTPLDSVDAQSAGLDGEQARGPDDTGPKR